MPPPGLRRGDCQAAPSEPVFPCDQDSTPQYPSSCPPDRHGVGSRPSEDPRHEMHTRPIRCQMVDHRWRPPVPPIPPARGAGPTPPRLNSSATATRTPLSASIPISPRVALACFSPALYAVASLVHRRVLLRPDFVQVSCTKSDHPSILDIALITSSSRWPPSADARLCQETRNRGHKWPIGHPCSRSQRLVKMLCIA